MLEDIHERLSGVIIENLDWTNLIDRYDRQGTLFYCDPPYWGSEHYYGKDLFNKEQFALMADRLGKLKGSFIMSINDVAEIRKLFSAFLIREVKVSYSCGGGTNINRAKELIITNFPRFNTHSSIWISSVITRIGRSLTPFDDALNPFKEPFKKPLF